MEKNKKQYLYEMLEHMSDYSVEQPKVIEDLCKDLFVSPAYAPALDLLVEAFLTIRSFSVLMFEGLVSNASAILRILIEQVATITVLAGNSKAMSEYLKFQTRKQQYYGSEGKKHENLRNFLFKESGYKHRKEKALKDYLDYGWVRVLNSDKSERSKKIIIEQAHLSEVIIDIDEQLNAFAHGQRSIFMFFRKKELADQHVSRIVMIAGKLFLFLCDAKQKLLVNEPMSADKYFGSYLNAKILYLYLNAKSVNARITNIIKTTDNIDRDIVYTLSTIDHMRGLMYQSVLNFEQVNIVSRAYVKSLVNFLFMICFKMFQNKKNLLNEVKDFYDLISKIGLDNIECYYKSSEHAVSLAELIKMARMTNDYWSPMKSNGQFEENDEKFMTDFASLAHSLFACAYPNKDFYELQESFISID